ncbi:MAG: metallophosphoesterase family protein [Caldilineaceae bacterium]|nr:metallophosphoesterase family protein [Caldilineaceae bacterium]
MLTAIFADLHDNYPALTTVLDDAAAQRADRLIFLGDAGRMPRILAALQVRKIPCVYGNWEVSGLRQLSGPLAQWVGAWPAVIRERTAVYCHATPDMPPALPTTAAAADWMKPGMSWSALFPRLHQNEDAVWQALAWMETENAAVAFHGHTHVQMVWTWDLATNHLHSSTGASRIHLAPGTRTIIGVGSAGVPEDGPWPRYALYDDLAGIVTLRTLRDR